jgi:hypothetical protein
MASIPQWKLDAQKAAEKREKETGDAVYVPPGTDGIPVNPASLVSRASVPRLRRVCAAVRLATLQRTSCAVCVFLCVFALCQTISTRAGMSIPAHNLPCHARISAPLSRGY